MLTLSRILGLSAPTQGDEAANKAYVDSLITGLAWKASVVAASDANVTVSNPGTASIGGVTLVQGDRVLLFGQTAPAENGIYVFDSSSTALVRATDSDSFDELEQAVVSVEDGTYADTTFRQTEIDGTIGTDAVVFETFGIVTPPASETVAGIAEIATQAEVDAGTDDSRFVTPLKLATYSGLVRKATGTVTGDGATTSFAVTHNFNTRDVVVNVYDSNGNYDNVLIDIYRPTVNGISIEFASAPAVGEDYSVVVLG